MHGTWAFISSSSMPHGLAQWLSQANNSLVRSLPVELDYLPSSITHMMQLEILPPFQIIVRFSILLSQTSLTLIMWYLFSKVHIACSAHYTATLKSWSWMRMTMGVPDFCKLECMICSDIHVVTMNVYVKVSRWATHYAWLVSNAKHVCPPS